MVPVWLLMAAREKSEATAEQPPSRWSTKLPDLWNRGTVGPTEAKVGVTKVNQTQSRSRLELTHFVFMMD